MNTAALNERQDVILALLRQRQEAGMRQLFEHYGGALLTVIQPIVRQKEVAEEVLHDVLVKIWNNVGQYDAGKARFFTWMARIAKNAAIDKTRSKEYRATHKTTEIDDVVGKRTELSVLPSVDHIGVRSLLDRLDDDHRAIIELLYLREFTQSEAAKELGIPLGTVKTRARRAIMQLREALQHEMLWLLLFSYLTHLPLP